MQPRPVYVHINILDIRLQELRVVQELGLSQQYKETIWPTRCP